MILFTEEVNVFGELFLADQILGGAAVGAIADHDQLGGKLFAELSEDFDHVGNALDRTEIRKVHDDGLAIGSPFGAKGRLVAAAVEIAIDEIGYDFDGPANFEFLYGAVFEVVGDGSDTVALLDRKSVV